MLSVLTLADDHVTSNKSARAADRERNACDCGRGIGCGSGWRGAGIGVPGRGRDAISPEARRPINTGNGSGRIENRTCRFCPDAKEGGVMIAVGEDDDGDYDAVYDSYSKNIIAEKFKGEEFRASCRRLHITSALNIHSTST
jgi:hypothetical protein